MTRKPTTVKQLKLTKPAPLKGGHNVIDFDCGEPSLNLWLEKHALKSLERRTANTFVVCRGRRVVGYFSLANSVVDHAAVNAKAKKNSPDPIPATLLARLAIDENEKGQGLGRDLLIDASKRAIAGTRHSAARLLLVHPLNPGSIKFYQKYGFKPTKGDSSAMYLPIETLVDGL